MQEKLPNSTLYLMSASAGLIVANLYYNQPLLAQIANSFGVSESAVSNVALSTQLGYAFALFFIIPLGDKISTNKILRLDFLVMVLSLMAAATATSLTFLIISSFFIGFTSALPQMFVPMVAQLSDEAGRGRAIGIVMSGLLIGILGSRVLSGLIGAQFGWRSVYYGGSFLMVLLFILLKIKLPNVRPTYKGTYGSLMKSLLHFFKTEPLLRLAALRGALSFAALSAFWTTLVFLLEDNFGYGSGVAGTFGLLGVAGALAATVVGKMNNKVCKNRIIIVSTILLIFSWGIFSLSAHSLIGLIFGAIVVDLGMQALHITNQNIIFSKNPDARNRVNTIYMVGFFLGGAIGTTLGAIAWQHYGWIGVSILGLALSAVILIAQLLAKNKTD